jgi:hypothetical protein
LDHRSCSEPQTGEQLQSTELREYPTGVLNVVTLHRDWTYTGQLQLVCWLRLLGGGLLKLKLLLLLAKAQQKLVQRRLFRAIGIELFSLITEIFGGQTSTH